MKKVNATYNTEIQKQIHDIYERINQNVSSSSSQTAFIGSNILDAGVFLDQIHEINHRLNEMQENQAKMVINNEKCKETLINLSNAVKCHNNTIVTHFDLNEAYAVDVIDKTNKCIGEMSTTSENMINKQKKKGDKNTQAIDSHAVLTTMNVKR